jgi:hypothetical protein
MKSLCTYALALGFFLGTWIPAQAVEPLSPSQESASTEDSGLFLLVIFSDVVFMQGGISAHVTGVNQKIAFLVVPNRLIDFENSEELPVPPEIHFGVNNLAFTTQGPSQYIQTCLNLMRELLVNKNTDLEMNLFLRVRRESDQQYAIREFLGCDLLPIDR